MPTARKRRRELKELANLQAFPPEGLSEPFKPTEIRWTQRLPFGTGGMNRAVSPDALAANQAYTLENFRVGLGSIEPAWGIDEIGSAKGTPKEILEAGYFKPVTQNVGELYRIDEDELQVWNGASWDVVPGNGDAMTGDETDRINSATILDSLIWVNGVDGPKQWLDGGGTYSDLSSDTNTPEAPRFLAAFADRAVFADVAPSGTRNTQRIEWSGNADATDYDGSSAGGVTLYDGQADAPADPIKGLAVQGDFLVVLRENSIWLGQRTGEAASPIEFRSVVQGYGVLSEGSVADCGSHGVIYLGKDDIYLYRPGLTTPIAIGTPIRDKLFESLATNYAAFVDNRTKAIYSPRTQEYWLFVPKDGDTWPDYAYVFSLDKLSKNEDGVSLVWTERIWPEGDNSISGVGIGQIGASARTNIYIGTPEGEVFEIEDDHATTNSQTYDCVFVSPTITTAPTQAQLSRINIAYLSDNRVPINLEFSLDGGTTWTVPTKVEILDTQATTKEVSFRVPLGVVGDSFSVRVTYKRPDLRRFKLVGYRLGFIERGPILGR